jgi:hypothetical protein
MSEVEDVLREEQEEYARYVRMAEAAACLTTGERARARGDHTP